MHERSSNTPHDFEARLRATREGLLVPPEIAFEDGLQAALGETDSFNERLQATSNSMMEQHGVPLGEMPPQALPAPHRLAHLTAEDWNTVRASPTPLLTVYSKTNLRDWEERGGVGMRSDGSYRRLHPSIEERALFGALPLAHSTSMKALLSAMEHGEFLSNRDLANQGVNVTATLGGTGIPDRKIGLDNYVFADFGRPSAYRLGDNQAEVIVLLHRSALQAQGAFVTEHDYLDPQINSNAHQYMSEYLDAPDFEAVGCEQLINKKSMVSDPAHYGSGRVHRNLDVTTFLREEKSDPDTSGQPSFTTWEVKLPRIGTNAIDRVIFRNPEQAADFHVRHASRFASEVNPHFGAALKHNAFEALGIGEEYNRQLVKEYEAHYERRKAVVDSAKEQVVGYRLISADVADAQPVPSGLAREKFPFPSVRWGSLYSEPSEALRWAKEGYDAYKGTSIFSFTIQAVRQGSVRLPLIQSSRILLARVRRGNDTEITESLTPYDLMQT